MRNHTPLSWGLDALREQQPDLRERPSSDGSLVLEGPVEFRGRNTDHGEVHEHFEVRLKVPDKFPRELPSVWELGGRIPPGFHTNLDDKSLCLGSPLQLFIELNAEPTLVGFVNRCLLPYFYNFVVGERTGTLPFGELAHGRKGLLSEYQRLLGARDAATTRALFHLLSVKKRIANKRPCPCGSGRRVGRCHHRFLNPLRKVHARSWFATHLGTLGS